MDMSRSTLTSNAPSLHSVVLDIAIRQGVTPAPILKGALLYKGGTVEVMITHRSVGTLFFLRDRCYHAHFQVVVIADALTVSFLPPCPMGFEIFDCPPGSKYCIVIPGLKSAV
jgi:hypothetical protein